MLAFSFSIRSVAIGSTHRNESNRNEYQESSWAKGLPERMADNLTAICEPIA
jgi:hypothetical protein